MVHVGQVVNYKSRSGKWYRVLIMATGTWASGVECAKVVFEWGSERWVPLHELEEVEARGYGDRAGPHAERERLRTERNRQIYDGLAEGTSLRPAKHNGG